MKGVGKMEMLLEVEVPDRFNVVTITHHPFVPGNGGARTMLREYVVSAVELLEFLDSDREWAETVIQIAPSETA